MDLYRELIMDHYKHPRNKGTLDNFDSEFSTNNGSCGDHINIQVKLEDNKIKDVKFSGFGCAISQASASLLTEKVKGMNIQEILKIEDKDSFEFLGIEKEPLRIKCITLSLNALKRAIKDDSRN